MTNAIMKTKIKSLTENEIAICNQFEVAEIANLTADLFITLKAENGLRWERARIEFDVCTNPEFENSGMTMTDYAEIVGLSKSAVSMECKAYQFITEYKEYSVPALTVDKAHELSKLGADVVDFVNDNGGIDNVLSVGGTKKLIELIKQWKNTVDSTAETIENETAETETAETTETMENETPCTEFEILGIKYKVPNHILAQYIVK